MFRKRWVRSLFVGLIVSVTLTIVTFFGNRYFENRAGEKRYAAIVAHLDATDPHWRYDEIEADRGQLPDAENSTLLVPRFTAVLANPRFDSDKLLDSSYASKGPPNHVLDDTTYEALDRALANNDEALSIARKFDGYPRGLRHYALAKNPIDTLQAGAQETRYVFRLLDLAAEREGRNGRGGRALGYVRPMLNAGRSLDGEPFMISALVRMACIKAVVVRVERTMALATPQQQLPEIQALLAQEAEADLFWYSLRGDRAALELMFARLRDGTLNFDDLSKSRSGPLQGGPSFESPFMSWWYTPYLAADHATYLEIMTRAQEIRTLPEHQQRAAFDRVVLEIKRLPPGESGSLITRLITPAANKLHDASLRARASLRCASVAVAVERFRQTHGRWPNELTEIPKEILPAIPLDPFDGQPLRFVHRDDGITVYSIGLDEKDDGGLILPGKLSTEPGQDIGCRLYNPEARNLPAMPELVPPGPRGEWERGEVVRGMRGPMPRVVERR